MKNLKLLLVFMFIIIMNMKNVEAQGYDMRQQLLQNQIINKNILLSPNPASNYLTLEFPFDGENVSIEFYDITGKLTLSFNNVSNSGMESLDVSGLQNGIYLVKIIKNGERIQVEKLSIVK